MRYLKSLFLPDDISEYKSLLSRSKNVYTSYYPYNIFSYKDFEEVDFDNITIFYGSNGSGKTTLLNIIGELIGVMRHSEFVCGDYFKKYLGLCELKYTAPENKSQFLSSDDVFDYIMNARYINQGVDNLRNDISREYQNLKHDYDYRFKGFDDYEKMKNMTEAKRLTESKYIKNRMRLNVDTYSNGETAMHYFINKIDKNCVYLLDEPENSLSVSYQLDLKKFIEDSARFYKCQFVISTHSPILLSLENAKIYNLDVRPVCCCKWTDLPNVRKYFEFFTEHKDEFEK